MLVTPMRRIVSLLPSATEIVYALGEGNSLVGVSHECDFPKEAMTKPKIIEPIFDSGTLASDQIDRLVSQSLKKGERLYKIKLDELKKADPDLIITQELCDVCAIGAADILEAVNQLGKRVDVISLNPHSLTDVKQDIRKVADALGLGENAERFVRELEDKAETIRGLTEKTTRPRVRCLEWLDPIMNAGHWVPEIVELAGGHDALASRAKFSTYID